MHGIHSSQPDAIRDLFIGRRVVSAEGSFLTLDDGRKLEVVPNEGGCICGAGDYELTSLNTCDNVITRVEVDETEADDGRFESDTRYTVFVYAENQKINLIQVDGNDGNGYYGTGFEIVVREA